MYIRRTVMKSTAKAVSMVMVIMVLSRLLSFVSNWYYITAFGTTGEMDVYSFSQQLPNIIFTVLGTSLTILIIPKFAGLIGVGEKQRAFRFVDAVLTLSVILTLILSVICIAATPLILMFTRFRTGPEHGFAVMALSIMFPVMVFYALNYIFQGILQSFEKFNAPAFVSVPSSLVVILYVALLGNKFGVKGLLIATFIGLSLQALILVPFIYKTEYRYHISFDYRNPDLRESIKLLPPVLLGTSAYQINMLVNVTLAANFEESVVSILTLIQNLMLYSILAFIFSVTAVLFPKFTVLAAKKDMDGFKETLASVLKVIIYFIIPASFGFLAVRYQFIDFIYGWGKITKDNVDLASKMMGYYALGLLGVSIKEVLDRVFYSLNDTVRPAVNGLIIMIVNVAGSFMLIRVNFLGVLGIPLAYSIAALTGGFVLIWMIRKKIGPFGGRDILLTTLKVLSSSVIMFCGVILCTKILGQFGTGYVIIDKAIQLLIPTFAGILIYFICTYLLKVKEAVDTINKIKLKLGRSA